MKKIKYISNTMLLIVALFYVSCSGDRVSEVVPPVYDQADVTISLNVPSATRSLTEPEQDAVRNIQVLAFDTDGNFAFSAYSNNTPDNRTFSVKLRKGTWSMVILANSLPVLAGLEVGTPRDQMLSSLTRSVTEGRGWNTDELRITGIPMSSGLLPAMPIDNNTTIDQVDLYRMVAKVDISVGATNFKLESVRVYNYEKTGLVYPVFSRDELALALPAGWSDKVQGYESGHLIYNKSDYTSTGEVGMSDTYCGGLIYLNPAAAGSRSTLEENTCVVVGGRYAQDAQVSYYRVDFSTEDGTYIDLVRNHRYLVSITKVGGSGETTANDAFDREPVNMTVEVVDWNQGDITDVVVHGQYGLGVSKKNYTFYANAVTQMQEENKLTVSTTYTDQWKIESVSDWLTIIRVNDGYSKSGTHTCAGSPSTSTILSEDFYLMLDANLTGQIRTGWVVVSAGDGLNQLVKVVQHITGSHTLYVSLPTINFPSAGDFLGFAVTSNTTWTVVGNEPWIEISPSSGTGNGMFYATAGPNTGEPRTVVLTVITTSGDPARIVTIPLEQDGQKASLNVSPNFLDFQGVGVPKTFHIASNDKWSITSNQSWCTFEPSSGSGNADITVNVARNTEANRSAIITVKTTSGSSITKTIAVTQDTYSSGGTGHRITVVGLGDYVKLVVTTDPADAGLYFKYGSVVGIYSAANGKNQVLPDGNVSTFSAANDIAYNPTTGISITGNGSIGWDKVPYTNTKIDITSTYHSIANLRQGKGDPCRLVDLTAKQVKDMLAAGTQVPDNKMWRLPTKNENIDFVAAPTSWYSSYDNDLYDTYAAFNGPLSGVRGGWFPIPGNRESTVGRKVLANDPESFIPLAGYRDSNGLSTGHNYYGDYWSSTAYGPTNGYSIYFTTALLQPN